MQFLFVLVFLLLNSVISNPLFATPTDTDSDGISNPLVVREGASELRWVSYSTNGESFNFADSFGISSDILAPGNYSTSGFMPAIINTNGIWNFANGRDIIFGDENSLFISGGDYDGDEIHDLAYATNTCQSKRTTFKILTNSQSDNSLEFTTRMRTKGNHYKFFFDINADGRDDLCSVIPLINRKIRSESGRFKILCKDINNTRSGGFKVGRIYSQPKTINLNGSPHLLVIRERRNKTIVRIRNNSGRIAYKKTIPVTGKLLVGKYLSESEEIIAIVKDNIASLYNPIDNSFQSMEFPSGTPIDSVNVESFQSDDNCFCNTRAIKRNGGCDSPKNEAPSPSDPDDTPSDFYIPNNCSNPPSNISAHDGFKCMGSSTRGGSVVCLLPYQFTWAPHKMVTDHHNYSFACNRNDESFTNVRIYLNDNSSISLSYAGCHNYVSTQDGWIGRQHFRNEGVNWDSIKNRATRIEMENGGKKTCLSL